VTGGAPQCGGGLSSQGVAELLDVAPKTSLQEAFKSLQEKVYKSHKEAPLGQSVRDTSHFPERLKQGDYRHGVTTVNSESAKTVIFSDHGVNKNVSDSPLEQLRQRTRGYDWEKMGIDLAAHSFGGALGCSHRFEAAVSDQSAANATGQANVLLSSALPSSQDTWQTRIVPKCASERDIGVGGVRQGSKALIDSLGEDFRFGSKPVAGDEWNAANCLRGAYSEEQQRPDPDLGRSKMSLKRERYMPASAEMRLFGVSTVRLDKTPPRVRSIADVNNYGDEAGARQLVHPQNNFYMDGLCEEDFSRERPESEILLLFNRLGTKFSQAEFARWTDMARKENAGVLSVAGFRKVYNQEKLGISTKA